MSNTEDTPDSVTDSVCFQVIATGFVSAAAIESALKWAELFDAEIVSIKGK